MEIMENTIDSKGIKEFKIDLIVWKSLSTLLRSRLLTLFKIDLIVWK